ncbi:MAG: hypothetical protein JWM61_1668 [Micrococcaceae bacterium]|nr:hypothetical protein [Micrococcaceae bacterium]
MSCHLNSLAVEECGAERQLAPFVEVRSRSQVHLGGASVVAGYPQPPQEVVPVRIIASGKEGFESAPTIAASMCHVTVIWSLRWISQAIHPKATTPCASRSNTGTAWSRQRGALPSVNGTH